MFFLLLGLAGDVFVAGYLLKLNWQVFSAAAGALVFIFGFVMWFGLTMAKRRQ
jgi:small neutral amino acid transporter SnatA (MarC family)